MPKKLHEYAERRDLEQSGEPSAIIQRSKNGNLFVVQQHHASHMHYDFRIEVNGVLKSWAVPKGPSTSPHDKRLAAETEDHPLDYAQFEGIIPEGYGAGTVIVWDMGTYDNLTTKNGREISVSEGIARGHIKIELHGKKLRGAYALTKFRERDWLFVKVNDKYADQESAITLDKPVSVLSKKTIEKLDLLYKREKNKS